MSKTIQTTYNNIARSISGKCAILGDSITAQISSCAQLTASLLGMPQIGTNYANGGTKIEDQAQHLDNIVAEGAKYIILQVGTNNTADAPSVLYGKYITLFQAVRDANLVPIIVLCPPRTSSFTKFQWKCNIAMYYAAQSFGWRVYDPWYQYALGAGGWSVATSSNDGLHPSMTTRKLAADILFDLITKDTPALPLVRSWRDPEDLIGFGLFQARTGGDPNLPGGWTLVTAGASATYRFEEIVSNNNKQFIKLTNPALNDFAELQITSASIGTAREDKYAVTAILDATTDDANLNYAYGYIKLIHLGSDGTTVRYTETIETSKTANGNTKVWHEFNPFGTGTYFIKVVVGVLSEAGYTGETEVGFSRVGLVNLTALSVP